MGRRPLGAAGLAAGEPTAVAPPPSPPGRAPAFPFGWGGVTVLVVGALLLVGGIAVVLYGFLGFLAATVGAAAAGDFALGPFFASFFGALLLLVLGGVLAGLGGWLLRLRWIFLVVGAVPGAGGGNTVREREGARASEVRIRCPHCGRLNPEGARSCLSCSRPV